MGGDSAGANLTAQLLCHLIEPHPAVQKVTLTEPLAGAFLVSPWLTMHTNDASYAENSHIDMLSGSTVERFTRELLGYIDVDEKHRMSSSLAFPLDREKVTFREMDSVVQQLYVVVGSHEAFRDQAVAFVRKVEHANPRLNLRFDIQGKQGHDFIFLEGQEERDGECIQEMMGWMEDVLAVGMKNVSGCVPCRTNKLKCDGFSPCQRCKTARASCHFAEGSAPVADTPQPSEREALLEAILRSRNMEVPKDLDSLRSFSEQLQPSNTDDDTSRNHGNVVIDHAPAPQTYVHDQGRTYFDGGSSAWAFFDSVRETVDESPKAARARHTAYRHFIIDPPTLLSSDLRASLIAALPPRSVLDFLATTFFRYSQSNYFSIHPAIFSRKIDAFLSGTHEFDPQGNNTTRRPIEFICILFMILAIGSQYADLEQNSSRDIDYPMLLADSASPDLTTISTPKPTPNPGWRFYRISRRLLSDVVSTCSMTSVQACVLQGTFLVSTSAHDTAYNVYGLAMRMAVNMGMHRAVGAEDLHPQVRELRNRLWWTLYTLERQLTFQLGRPLMLDDDEIDASFPVDLPELRVPQYTSSVEGQIALIKLCRIMGRIVKFMYSRSAPAGGRQVIDTKASSQLKGLLLDWKAQLPHKLQIAHAATRGAVHLNLTYEQAVMLLSRIPLSHAAASEDNEQHGAGHQHKIKFLQDAIRDCVSAALATIKMFKTLKERRLLCRYSCQDPLYCSSALHVLLLGAKLESPTESTKRTIAEGINVLRELARGSETAASSLGAILSGFEPFFRTTSDSAADDPSTSDITRTQGHQAWQEWVLEHNNIATYHPEILDDGGMTSPGIGNDEYREVRSRGDESTALYPWTGTEGVEPSSIAAMVQPADGETQVVSPDYEQLIPQNLLHGWMANGQPFWLSDLNNSFDVLEHNLTQTPAADNLNIWDIMPADLGSQMGSGLSHGSPG
ncbi:C6 transcription factor [Fusarium albosuccineum]|uniref:C6 transcription factor n=1 Tax=Fusarium albosuccineum TaxID=1237068 RepID=A0A8H4L7K5_9HYPO|nr:C6 transcription factor [Fusarium albosuccineum]